MQQDNPSSTASSQPYTLDSLHKRKLVPQPILKDQPKHHVFLFLWLFKNVISFTYYIL